MPSKYFALFYDCKVRSIKTYFCVFFIFAARCIWVGVAGFGTVVGCCCCVRRISVEKKKAILLIQHRLRSVCTICVLPLPAFYSQFFFLSSSLFSSQLSVGVCLFSHPLTHTRACCAIFSSLLFFSTCFRFFSIMILIHIECVGKHVFWILLLRRIRL